MIETVPSKLYWLLGIFLCFLVSWFFYKNEFFLNKNENRLKWILVLLRGSSLFVVFFLCLEPFVSYQQKQNLKPELLVLLDNSQSIKLGGLTLDSIQDKLGDLNTNLSGDLKTNIKNFGRKINRTDTLSFNDSKTDFQQAFLDAENLYEGRNLVGVVVISDGILNSGAKQNLHSNFNCPIYTVGVGDTSLKKDFVLKHLYHNDKTIVGNQIPVRVEGVGHGYRGKKMEVEFYFGNQKIGSEKLLVNKDSYSFTLNKKILADSIGLRKLKVRIVHEDNEFTHSNNELVGFVEVVKEKKKIQILYDSPHPDVAAFKASMGSIDAYEVLSSSFENYKWNNEADLLVLFGMPKNKIDFVEVESKLKSQSSNWLFFLNSKVRHEWLSAPEFKVEHVGGSNDVQINVNQSFPLFNFSKESVSKLLSFPPLAAPYGEYVFARDFKVFGTQKIGKTNTEFPFICFKQNDSRRIAVVAGEGVWKWRMHEVKESPDAKADAFDELFQKTVKYLTLEFSDENIQLEAKSMFELGEKIMLKAIILNSIKEPVMNKEVKVNVKGEGVNLNLVMNNLDEGYLLELGALNPGEYNITLSSYLDGKIISFSKKIVVKPFYFEQMVLQANHGFLRELSIKSEGRFYGFDQVNNLANDLNERRYSIKSYFEFFTTNLMEFKLLLYMLIAMLGAEWFIRKWYGTI